MAIVLPPRCLLCGEPWTDKPHLGRGLHHRCYHRMWYASRLEEFPILRYAVRVNYEPVPKEKVSCLTPDCENTTTRYVSRINKTYRCSRCKYAKIMTGGYDHRLLARYDQSLPPMERVLYWLDPDNQQQFRGVPTPFVKPGGPDGDCLIWQRQLHGNRRQMETGDTYAKVHWYKRQERVHRIVYSVFNDIPLDELLIVDHSCEIKQCVNPAHLGAETLSGNTAGRIRTLRHDRLWNDPDALRARLAELEEAA